MAALERHSGIEAGRRELGRWATVVQLARIRGMAPQLSYP